MPDQRLERLLGLAFHSTPELSLGHRFSTLGAAGLRDSSASAGWSNRQATFVGKSTGSITTLIFDWDGTLFDSARAGLLAFQKTFADLGIEFTPEFYEARYSPNWYAMYEALGLPKEDWTRADELWLAHYGEEPPKLVDGAGATLAELHSRNYRLGIVSSGTHRRIAREIDRLGLIDTFEALICNEHIVNKKPHPEGLEHAIRLLDCTPQTCSYVGDAPEDVRMGKSAGVLTVGVSSSYPTSKHLLIETPDIYLENISELLVHFRNG